VGYPRNTPRAPCIRGGCTPHSRRTCHEGCDILQAETFTFLVGNAPGARRADQHHLTVAC
jgi:hypothetical protein